VINVCKPKELCLKELAEREECEGHGGVFVCRNGLCMCAGEEMIDLKELEVLEQCLRDGGVYVCTGGSCFCKDIDE
jgi:nitrite reductase/ring-hydroxylating ferredoxin subunit